MEFFPKTARTKAWPPKQKPEEFQVLIEFFRFLLCSSLDKLLIILFFSELQQDTVLSFTNLAEAVPAENESTLPGEDSHIGL
ncbi:MULTISPECIES: hypothetical protein [Sediminibacillus]|uniref:hypothetical protein n=1 Tax=Sediminibacillus TaxID=482460 RepID=UPI0003FC8EDD|nr:hypothetical protein [Sediminibacillus terrae]